MSLARMYTKTFSSAEALCQFINEKEISVIESIVVCDGMYQLFYRVDN